MFNRKITLFAATLSLLANAWPAFSEDTSEPVKVKTAELPEATRKAIHAQLGKGSVTDIEKTEDDGEVTYAVEMKKGGKSHSYTFDEEGTLLDEEISLDEIPVAVREAITKAARAGEVEETRKLYDDGKVSYGAEITVADKTRALTFDEKGALIEEQFFANELPAAVVQSLQKERGNGTVGEIVRESEDGEVTYEVDITGGGKSRTVIVDPQGQIVAREKVVALRDIPDAAQAAITALAKEGRTSAITEHVEDGETTYDFEVKRGGKWESISIGTDGKAAD